MTARVVWFQAGLLMLALAVRQVPAQQVQAPYEPAGWQARIEQLEREVRQLRAQSQAVSPLNAPDEPLIRELPSPSSAAGVAVEASPEPLADEVYWTPADSLPAQTDPSYPTSRVTGFFHMDLGWFEQDALSRQTVGDLQDGWDFRRARLAATGQVSQHVSYLMEFDFAQAQPWFVDVWMEFQDVANWMNLRIGRFRQPFGMTELNSIRNLTFLERPSLFALAPFRQTGVMAYGNDAGDRSNFTWYLSGYRYLSDSFGNVYGEDGGWGIATRVTTLLLYEDCGHRLIHLGADYSWNDPARDTVQFAALPEFFLGDNPLAGPAGLDKLPLDSVPPFANTGPMSTDETNLFNLEAAAAYGNLSLQSEVRWAVVDRLGGLGTEIFPGAYAHARYLLTGDTLPYERDSGVFGRVTPNNPVRFGGGGGCGAWEIAARWSWLDLDGISLPGPGRELTNLTWGVNWYLNGYTKFQFNYIHAILDDSALGESHTNLFALRGQIDF